MINSATTSQGIHSIANNFAINKQMLMRARVCVVLFRDFVFILKHFILYFIIDDDWLTVTESDLMNMLETQCGIRATSNPSAVSSALSSYLTSKSDAIQ